MSVMRQRGRQQENGEGKTDIEKQLGSQDDGADSGGNWTNRDPMGGPIFQYWHAMFVVFGVIAVLCVDPLFFYLPVINENHKCIALDRRLKITAISLRSFFDVIYLANMILGFPCLRKRFPCHRKSHSEASRSTSGRTELTNKCLRYLEFVIDILAILPIPQVFVPIIFSKMGSSKFLDIKKLLNALVLLQYVPRVLPIYSSWRKLIQSSKTLARSIWIIAGLNFFVYILASHVIGAFWYFFSIEREMACWHVACEKHFECTPSSFKCGRNLGNYTFLDDACPVRTPNTTIVDFGIFLEALQSGTVSSTNILQKILHCFWWGLRNLSSFGQNLQTSTYFWENCFSVFISIFGLLLFLYFIGNVQTYIQMATEKATKKATEKAEMEAKKLEKATEKAEIEAKKLEMEAKKLEKISHQMKIKKTTIQLWISKHKLPDDIKKQVIACIKQRLEENKDFDTEKPIHHLSNKELLKEIKRHLCLPLLKKVQILNKKKLYLLWICESLKPIYYNEDSYIFREGEPLTAMLFITQGSVWCFKTSNGDQNGEGSVSCAQCIEKGEFYGEELLEWGFKGSPSPKLSDLPISKTVKTLTKVEAFALTANDWKMIVARYAQATSQAVSFAKDFRRRINEKINKSSPKMAEQNNASCHALSASRLAVLQDKFVLKVFVLCATGLPAIELLVV